MMKTVASGKYANELGGNIGFVYTNPLSMGSSSSAHYGGNAKTYMNVGLAMGETMVELLGGSTASSARSSSFGSTRSTVGAGSTGSSLGSGGSRGSDEFERAFGR